MQGKHGHLSREQKQLALRLHAKGWRLVDIAREIGCSAPMVGIMARTGRHLDAKPFGWEPRAGHLTIDERETVLLGLGRGETLTAIAQDLGRAVSTVSREVKRGGGRAGYSAWHAHERARHQARRPKPFKLVEGPLLAEVARRAARTRATTRAPRLKAHAVLSGGRYELPNAPAGPRFLFSRRPGCEPLGGQPERPRRTIRRRGPDVQVSRPNGRRAGRRARAGPWSAADRPGSR